MQGVSSQSARTLYNLIFTRSNDSREILEVIDEFPFFVLGEHVNIGFCFGHLKGKSSGRHAVTEDQI